MRWLTVLAAILATLTLRSTALAPEAADIETDLLVYGATPAGITAAIAAAREGVEVVVVEPTAHVGGMMTSGLSWTDRGDETVIGGLADEFFDRVQAAVGSRRARYAFEPSVAESVFTEMLAEAGVEILLGRRLADDDPVEMDGGRITRAILDSGEVVTAEVFIDAGYEADLMAAAGVGYRIGREPASEFDERLAGVVEPEVVMTVPPGMESGFPLAAPGPVGSGDDRIQGSNYRLCLSTDPENQVPFAAPRDYDPSRWDIVVEYMEQRLERGDAPELDWAFHVRRLVRDKWDLNNVGPMSVGLPGANYDYPEAGPEERAAIAAYHREHQQGFLYFLANDDRVPEAIRSEVRTFGLCADEFVDSDNWPPLLYLREGRRMVGAEMVTQHDIDGVRSKPDVIGLASYRLDSHHVSRWIDADNRLLLEGKLGTPAPMSWAIPYGSIVPRADEATNLLVPVAASASHVAWSSLRMEPQFMIMGHAAGTAAAMAVASGSAVQNVPIESLQAALRAAGAVLDDPGDIGTSSFYDEIRWAYLEGIIGHCTEPGFFCPNEPVTRGMLAAFLASSLDLPPASRDHFSDDDGRTDEDAINRLAEAGLASGCNETAFCPEEAVTASRAARLLERAYGLSDSTVEPFTDDGIPITRGQMMALLYRIEVGAGG